MGVGIMRVCTCDGAEVEGIGEVSVQDEGQDELHL